MRKVTVLFDEQFHLATQDHKNEMQNCVGYLATWALHSERYCNCNIFGDSHGNLHANYSDKDNNSTYSMFGQLGEDGKYSTHS